MKPVLALLAAGIVALTLRGALSGLLPPTLRPDLLLLVVVGLGLHRPGVSGLLLAAVLGCVADVLTGALLGQHSLLFAVAFAVTRLAGAQLDLRRGLPMAFLVAGLSAFHGVGTAALSRLFGGHGSQVAWPAVDRLLGQAALDALLAPLVLPLLGRLVQRLSDDDRRAVQLAPRRREV